MDLITVSVRGEGGVVFDMDIHDRMNQSIADRIRSGKIALVDDEARGVLEAAGFFGEVETPAEEPKKATGKITKPMIAQALSDAGVEFNSKAKKDELLAIAADNGVEVVAA